MPSNPTPLKRYTGLTMGSRITDDWCESSDVAALEAERDALKAEVEELKACNRGLAADQQPLIDDLNAAHAEIAALKEDRQ